MDAFWRITGRWHDVVSAVSSAKEGDKEVEVCCLAAKARPEGWEMMWRWVLLLVVEQKKKVTLPYCNSAMGLGVSINSSPFVCSSDFFPNAKKAPWWAVSWRCVYVGNVVHCWSKHCFPCLFSLSLSTVWLDISVFPISVTFFITWYWSLYIPSILNLSYSSCLYFYRRYAYTPFLELEVVAQKELKITELHIANFVHSSVAGLLCI